MLEKSKLGVFLVLCFGADLEGNQKETTSVEGSPYFDTNLIVKRAHVDVLVSTCKPILKRLIRLPSTPTLRKSTIPEPDLCRDRYCVWVSCLFAKTRMVRFARCWLRKDLCNSSRASRMRSRSELSTTKMRALVDS